MRIFREVELNHQGEGVYEGFAEFLASILMMVRDPLWKGFFYSLGAMGQAIAADESTQTLSRELKYSILLEPVAGGQILRQEHWLFEQ